MPTSRPDHLNWLCYQILRLKPKSILDIGIGFGSKGMLFREYTDIWNLRYKNWQTKIDGIEIFEEYITQLQKEIYTNIYIGNALNVIDKLGEYDIIHMGDIIEHFTKKEGKKLLEKAKEHGKVTIVTTPIHVSPQKAVMNNDHETHKSQWTKRDFPGSQTFTKRNKLIIKIE